MTRRGRAVLAVLVTSAGLVAAIAAPAHADLWQLSEGFEGDPATTWQVRSYGASAGGFEINAGTARSGSNNAWLTAETEFSSVARSVYLRPAQLHRPTCGASIYLRPFPGADGGDVRVNVEVIDPSNWNYIALKTVTLTGSGYTQVSTPSWKPGPITVFVRVSLLGVGGYSGLRVDDLNVQCWGYYSS
jgi:hypothetical protein